MKNKHIIKKNFEFQDIIGLQQKAANSSFFIFYRSSVFPHLRYGISVGKKILKKANQRNQVKRQIRVMMYDFLKEQEIPNKDIIIMIRPQYLKNDFKTNEKILHQILNTLKKTR